LSLLNIALYCLLLVCGSVYAQPFQVYEFQQSSSKLQTMSEGLQVTQNSRYASFNGYNGFELPLGMPEKSEFDYTVSFWFRSKLSLE
jgi:hypothetical protein